MSKEDEAIEEIKKAAEEICKRKGIFPTVLTGTNNTKHGYADYVKFEFLKE